MIGRFTRFLEKKKIRRTGDSLFGLPIQPLAPQRNSVMNVASRRMSKVMHAAIDSFSSERATRELLKKEEGVWLERGEKRALALFYAAAKHVPAYKDFLAKHGITPSHVRTMEDFKKIPLIDKDNYLQAYPIEQLCWYGDITSNHIISVSSGSCGKPFFWPRAHILDAETALEHELFLANFFKLDQHSTLFIVCFAMGMYVAGPITLNSILRMSEKGYPVTVVTPGYSPEDVLRIIPELAPKYDQVVIAGYPPYIKEILDKGAHTGTEWKDIRLRFLLAGEGFNETWRSYVAELAGGKSPTHDFLNLYGTADAAVVAHETEASVIIRRKVAKNVDLRRKLFREERLPSLLQFHPEHKYIEEVNNELVITTSGGIPLIRYNLHDAGGVLSKEQIVNAVPELRDKFEELTLRGKVWNIPFVYVFGKSDQTSILYGANVYPENIKRALEEEDLRSNFTGKMVLYTDLDSNKDQRLWVEIECQQGIEPNKALENRVKERIVDILLHENSEYRVVHQGIGARTIPHVVLYQFGDDRFQIKRIKHAWTKKLLS